MFSIDCHMLSSFLTLLTDEHFSGIRKHVFVADGGFLRHDWICKMYKLKCLAFRFAPILNCENDTGAFRLVSVLLSWGQIPFRSSFFLTSSHYFLSSSTPPACQIEMYRRSTTTRTTQLYCTANPTTPSLLISLKFLIFVLVDYRYDHRKVLSFFICSGIKIGCSIEGKPMTPKLIVYAHICLHCRTFLISTFSHFRILACTNFRDNQERSTTFLPALANKDGGNQRRLLHPRNRHESIMK